MWECDLSMTAVLALHMPQPEEPTCRLGSPAAAWFFVSEPIFPHVSHLLVKSSSISAVQLERIIPSYLQIWCRKFGQEEIQLLREYLSVLEHNS